MAYYNSGFGDIRTQVMEINTAYYDAGTGVQTNTVELVKTPTHKAIVDPSKTTITFNGDDQAEINVYHYALTNVKHRFKFFTL